MKTIIKFVILLSVLLFATQCLAQFGNTNGTKFPYTNGVSRNDVFIIGTPGVTNKNIAASNMLSAIDGIANPASLKLATNGSLVTGPINILIGSNVLSASAASNAVVIGVNTAGNVIGDGTIFISGGSASGGADTGGIGIGYGVGAGINAVTIGTQNDNFSIQGASVGFGGATSGKWVISIGANNNSDTVTNVIMIGHDLAVTSNNVAIYGGADILRSFIAGTVVASNYTGNAVGLTNIANANVVSAGTGITIVTNTTAGTGTKEYVLTSTGGSATTITNTVSDAGILVGGNGSYGVGSANFYKTNSGANKTYTNLFGGKWDNTGTAPIFYVGPNANTYFNDEAGQNNYVGGILHVANDLYVTGTINGSIAASSVTPSGAVSNGQASVTFGTLSATTLNITTANVTNMVSAGATNGYLFANSNGVVVATREILATNVATPVFKLYTQELVTTGNATNYTVDFATTNLQTINATGNVYIASLSGIAAGTAKQLIITNVFKASSNITCYIQTNLLWLGPTNDYALGASPMHTNRAYPVTNVLVISLQPIGTTAQSILSYGIPSTP